MAIEDSQGRFERLVAGLSYKPGASFRFLPPKTLLIRIPVHPLTPSSQAQELWSDITLKPDFSDEEILKRIFNAVRALELHELSEWLKYQNEPIQDPHPEID